MWSGAGNAKDCRSFFNANSAGGAGTAARQAAFNRKQVFAIEFAAGRPGLKSRQGTASQGGVVQLESQEKEEGFVLGNSLLGSLVALQGFVCLCSLSWGSSRSSEPWQEAQTQTGFQKPGKCDEAEVEHSIN